MGLDAFTNPRCLDGSSFRRFQMKARSNAFGSNTAGVLCLLLQSTGGERIGSMLRRNPFEQAGVRLAEAM